MNTSTLPTTPITAPLTIVAICKAKPGTAAKLRAAQEALVKETLKEPGCLGYALHQSQEDENTLVFVETWETEALWRDHMGGVAIQRFRETGANEYFADFTLHRLTKVAG